MLILHPFLLQTAITTVENAVQKPNFFVSCSQSSCITPLSREWLNVKTITFREITMKALAIKFQISQEKLDLLAVKLTVKKDILIKCLSEYFSHKGKICSFGKSKISRQQYS